MKPSDSEHTAALAEANRMRNVGDDPHALAKTVLYQQHRLEALEKVMHAADRYIRFGQAEHEHSLLVQAMEAARRVEEQEAGQAEEDLGLG